MRRASRWVLLSLAFFSTVSRADHRVQKDTPYVDGGGERNRLDVYPPPSGDEHPIVV